MRFNPPKLNLRQDEIFDKHSTLSQRRALMERIFDDVHHAIRGYWYGSDGSHYRTQVSTRIPHQTVFQTYGLAKSFAKLTHEKCCYFRNFTDMNSIMTRKCGILLFNQRVFIVDISKSKVEIQQVQVGNEGYSLKANNSVMNSWILEEIHEEIKKFTKNH